MDTKLLLISALISGLAACAPASREPAAENDQGDFELINNVVYGADDRRDLYQVTDTNLLRLTASTVALVKSTTLTAQSGGFSLAGKNYGDEYGLCANEPFREQNLSAFCSGSLVGPDLILTAGHCVRTVADCGTTSFVFGFAVTAPGVQARDFATNDVYRCAQIVARDERGNGADYALIKLDRPVIGRDPLKIRRQGEVAIGQGLVVIGHPSGLPVKIAGGGSVRSTASPDFIVANLDTYGGNSGSAVFNADTGEIEGILVRGDTDFQRVGSCVASVVRDLNGGRGEDVTRVSKVKDLIPELPVETAPAVFRVQPALAIPDNDRAGVSVALAVPVAVQNRKVVVAVKLTHTYIGDLIISLVAPNGQKVVLHNRAGGSKKDLNVIYGRDAASARILAGLSQASAGSWKLEVQDVAARDVGTVDSFSIGFE